MRAANRSAPNVRERRRKEALMPQAATAGPDTEYPTRPPAAMEPQERLWR